MAMTGIQLITNPAELQKVKQEFQLFTKCNPYKCPIPNEVKPTVLKI